jgi:hypothetical protein
VKQRRFDVGMTENDFQRVSDFGGKVWRLDFRRGREVLEDDVIRNPDQELEIRRKRSDLETRDDDFAGFVVVDVEQVRVRTIVTEKTKTIKTCFTTLTSTSKTLHNHYLATNYQDSQKVNPHQKHYIIII